MIPPFFVTIPHSGEEIPPEIHWLKDLPEPIQMCDVDRYVDILYSPSLEKYRIPFVTTQWHRYFADLNRTPDDVDMSSVQGSKKPTGSHPTGFIWTVTTKGDQLLPQPIEPDIFRQIVLKYWQPFHDQVKAAYQNYFSQGHKSVFQLDAHSMPSLGTDKHSDPGEQRAEIVISDQNGKSCHPSYRDLVVNAYKNAGFEVKLNWPYVGGKVTQTYGHPEKGQHCIQVELNRRLYMDEESKKLKPQLSHKIQQQLEFALEEVRSGVKGVRL